MNRKPTVKLLQQLPVLLSKVIKPEYKIGTVIQVPGFGKAKVIGEVVFSPEGEPSPGWRIPVCFIGEELAGQEAKLHYEDLVALCLQEAA